MLELICTLWEEKMQVINRKYAFFVCLHFCSKRATIKNLHVTIKRVLLYFFSETTIFQLEGI